MGDHKDLTVGEIGRSVERIEAAVADLRTEVRDRHHALANQVNVALGPLSEIRVRLDRCEEDINGLGTKVDTLDAKIDNVQSRADKMSGAVALAALIGTLIPWPWKMR